MRAGEAGCGDMGTCMNAVCRLEPAWQLQDWLAINCSVAHAVREIRCSFAKVPSRNNSCVCLLPRVLPLL